MRRGVGLALVVLVAVATLSALPAPPAEAAPACTITGTAKADVLKGTKRADVICARGGADKIIGRGGGDVLRGGRGNDTLRGGAGADTLIGGAGRDSCRDTRATTSFSGCEQRPRKRDRLLDPRFTCCFVPPDVTPPVVRGVHFNEPYVDVSSEEEIGFWVEAEDPHSGIGLVELELEGPAGPWQRLSFPSEDPYGWAAWTSVPVPASTPAGSYRVTGLKISDRAGNGVSFDASQLEEAGFSAKFDVFEGPDTEGPELTDFSLSPATLDTSGGPGSVNFTLEATDGLSGVEEAAALIRLPDSGPPICFPCGHRASSTLTTGTIYDGTWTEQLPLPQFAKPGTYLVSAVVLYDRAGNRTAYGPAELEELGYPVEFSQSGDGDTQPPQLVDFWISPESLQTSNGNRAIQFFVHIKDDLSGVGETAGSVFERMRVDVQPPPESEGWYTEGGVTQVSGTELDGVWRFEKILPADAPTGTWTVPAIEATDHAGNQTLLQGAELKATGWDLAFENLP